MDFRTEISIEPSYSKIHHQSRILLLGSCFADVIGNKLKNHKFPAMVNPFGTLFNPLSISKLINLALSQNKLPDPSYIRSGDQWFNYHLHSSLSGNSKESLSERINQTLQAVRNELLNVDFLIITLGTAYVYKLKDSDDTVANCHRMPATHFSKVLLSPDQITLSLKETLLAIKNINPKTEIILTVSPVRHIKDTLPMNSVSKSVLRYATYLLNTDLPFCHYFPAFEILNDDLRDYRFFKEDMIHATEQAEEYIWEKFSDCFFSKETNELNKEWAMIAKALKHRPFNADSEAHKSFLSSTLERVLRLSDALPLEMEIQELKSRLNG